MPDFFKPKWVKHSNGEPIYSIDVHPGGAIFATGGGDCKVLLWSLEPILDKTKEKDKALKTPIALESHTKHVNCVRWASTGKYLASSSDDHTIIIWEQKRGPGAAFGASGNRGDWSPKHIFRGQHTSDISDICWSPDCSKLASCSADNKIAIYDIDKMAFLYYLEGHVGMVKGVAWDVTGKFLASQSDDKCALIWRVADRAIEKKIEKPFRRTGDALFNRPSWSPDGQYLVTAGAVENKKHVAAIVVRKDWSFDRNYIGHSKSVTCVKFNPTSYRKDGEQFFCCALGGADKVISIWVTHKPMAVVVVRNIFQQAVLDLSWAPSGTTLLASSLDGTIGVVTFAEGELGERVPKLETERHLQELYGQATGSMLSAAAMIEDPSLYEYVNDKTNSNSSNHATSTTTGTQRKGAFSTSLTSKPTAVVTATDGKSSAMHITLAPNSTIQQVVTKLPGGKKRISPQVIEESFDSGGSRFGPITSSLSSSNDNSFPAFSSTSVAGAMPTSTIGRPKKKIIPTPVAAPPSPAPTAATTTVTTTTGQSSSKPPGVESAPGSNKKKRKFNQLEQSSDAVPAVASPTSGTPAASETEQVKRKRGKPKRIKLDEPAPSVTTEEMAVDEPTAPASTQSAAPAILIPLPDNIPLRLAKHVTHVPHPLEAAQDVLLEARVTETEFGVVTELEYISGGVKLWKDRLRSRVIRITGVTDFVAASCINGDVYIYSSAGRRIAPCLSLGAPTVFLESSAKRLMAITTTAQAYVWDIGELSTDLDTSVAPVFGSARPQSTLEGATLAPDGKCVLMMSSGESYSFNPSLKCWCRVYDSAFVASEFAPARPFGVSGPLTTAMIEGAKKNPFALSRMVAASEADKIVETIAGIEQHMAAAELLNSPQEYKHWLMIYVRHLTENSMEKKLEEFCAALLGPLHVPSEVLDVQASRSAWNPLIMTLSKRDLLKEVLEVMSRNREIQRLVSRYKDDLSTIIDNDKAASLSQEN